MNQKVQKDKISFIKTHDLIQTKNINYSKQNSQKSYTVERCDKNVQARNSTTKLY